jgi:hypothetical protein
LASDPGPGHWPLAPTFLAAGSESKQPSPASHQEKSKSAEADFNAPKHRDIAHRSSPSPSPLQRRGWQDGGDPGDIVCRSVNNGCRRYQVNWTWALAAARVESSELNGGRRHSSVPQQLARSPRDHQSLAGPAERKVEQPETRARSSQPDGLQAGPARRWQWQIEQCIERKTRTTAHAKSALSSNILDPHYPPSYPLAVLNSSPPSSSSSTHLGLSQPSRLLFILRLQLCIVSTPRSESPHWLSARIITYRQARRRH